MTAELPPEWEEFVRCFDRGDFWRSHEILEAPWRRHHSPFYKGMILYASALVHVARGNPRGVLAQLAKAETHLRPFRPCYLGLDVNALLEHAGRCRKTIGADPDAPRGGWRERIPELRLDPRPRRVRGDEFELRVDG